jgi:hypothetical protein
MGGACCRRRGESGQGTRAAWRRRCQRGRARELAQACMWRAPLTRAAPASPVAKKRAAKANAGARSESFLIWGSCVPPLWPSRPRAATRVEPSADLIRDLLRRPRGAWPRPGASAVFIFGRRAGRAFRTQHGMQLRPNAGNTLARRIQDLRSREGEGVATPVRRRRRRPALSRAANAAKGLNRSLFTAAGASRSFPYAIGLLHGYRGCPLQGGWRERCAPGGRRGPSCAEREPGPRHYWVLFTSEWACTPSSVCSPDLTQCTCGLLPE